MQVKIKKLTSRAIIPTKGSSDAAGMDLYALLDEPVTINPNETYLIKTGLSYEIPSGYVGLIFARSGLATKEGLAPSNKVGVIDADYRGEIMVSLYNQSNTPRVINDGQRIAQMVIMPILDVELVVDDNLSDTDRGEGGFGSTGKK